MIDLRTVPVGYRFPDQSLTLDAATLAAYVAAVEDSSPLYGDEGLAPPLAVLALAMGDLVDLLARHPGTVHLSQKLHLSRAVPVGTKVVAALTVQGRSERRGFAALTLDVRVNAADGPVLTGAMLLMVPLAQTEVAGG